MAIQLHPDSSDFSYDNDYMLLKLDQASTKSTMAYNTNKKVPTTGTTVTVIGFGTTSEEAEISSQQLLKVDVQVDDFGTCDTGESLFLSLALLLLLLLWVVGNLFFFF
jgi:Trypsin